MILNIYGNFGKKVSGHIYLERVAVKCAKTLKTTFKNTKDYMALFGDTARDKYSKQSLAYKIVNIPK